MDVTRPELAVGLVAGVLLARCVLPAPHGGQINATIEKDKGVVVTKVRGQCSAPGAGLARASLGLARPDRARSTRACARTT